MSPDEVLSALMSFKSGSAAGPDGLSPQHYKDLICGNSGDAGRSLLASLVSLVNLMLSGKVPSNIAEVLYGAHLCALQKKDGLDRLRSVTQFVG